MYTYDDLKKANQGYDISIYDVYWIDETMAAMEMVFLYLRSDRVEMAKILTLSIRSSAFYCNFMLGDSNLKPSKSFSDY